MNIRHRTFAEEYVRNGGNALAAYQKAYGRKVYGKSTATSAANLLRRPVIRTLIAEYQTAAQQADNPLTITRERVTEEVIADVVGARAEKKWSTALRGWHLVAKLWGLEKQKALQARNQTTANLATEFAAMFQQPKHQQHPAKLKSQPLPKTKPQTTPKRKT